MNKLSLLGVRARETGDGGEGKPGRGAVKVQVGAIGSPEGELVGQAGIGKAVLQIWNC